MKEYIVNYVKENYDLSKWEHNIIGLKLDLYDDLYEDEKAIEKAKTSEEMWDYTLRETIEDVVDDLTRENPALKPAKNWDIEYKYLKLEEQAELETYDDDTGFESWYTATATSADGEHYKVTWYADRMVRYGTEDESGCVSNWNDPTYIEKIDD